MSRVVVCSALVLCFAATEARAERMVLTNRTTSCGAANRGKLSNGVRLPHKGVGYVIPKIWRKRNYRYGTREMINMITRAARRVAQRYPGAMLGVADISKKNGGTLYNHRSHQSGRDVDLHYYAVDRKNRPFFPDKFMPYYMYNGRAVYAKMPGYVRIKERFFDLKRNWAFVKEILSDPTVTVTHIFASYQIKKWLLKYAKQQRENAALISRATKVIMQPSDSKNHNDHMHVRISCTAHDVRTGRCLTRNWPTPRRLIGKKRIRLYYWRSCPAGNNS